MLILSRHEVESLLTMPEAIDAVEEGFRRLAIGSESAPVVMPQRTATPIAPHNGLHLSMPVFVGGQGENDAGILAIKMVTVYGDNPARYGLPTIQGVLLLHDAATGSPLALMDAEHLTAMRTGAASGVATRYLARPDAERVLIFGAGAQAGCQLSAMCAVRPIRRAWVVTRTGVKDAEFCARMSAELGISVERAGDIAAAIAQADILCAATTAREPLFSGDLLRPGAHINAVGAYTRDLREMDAVAVRRSKLYVDHHTAAQTEAGDILLALASGDITPDHVVGSLGEVVAGRVAGRAAPEEITLFKSVGLAMQDAVTAALVYARALERGVGSRAAL